LIKLDLPTLERPRKATSGKLGGGKWLASLADVMNRVKTRMYQCAVRSGKMQVGKNGSY